jgi:hypothetical protein
VAILPSMQYSQFVVVNQDHSILAASTSHPATFAVQCAAPSGISGAATSTSPVVFDENARLCTKWARVHRAALWAQGCPSREQHAIAPLRFCSPGRLPRFLPMMRSMDAC